MTLVTSEGIFLPATATKATVAIVYNDLGEQIKVSQPLTPTTTMHRYWTYDGAGRTKTFRDAKGTTTTTYNLAGWPTQIADPRPVTVHLGYDNLGRRVCRFPAACTASTSGAETYAYDAAGNMTQAKNATATFNLEYDDDGRLWKMKKGTTLETTYTYDPTTAQLTSITDAAGVTGFEYVANTGRIWKVDDPLAGANKSVYGYDTAGRLITRVLGRGRTGPLADGLDTAATPPGTTRGGVLSAPGPDRVARVPRQIITSRRTRVAAPRGEPCSPRRGRTVEATGAPDVWGAGALWACRPLGGRSWRSSSGPSCRSASCGRAGRGSS